MTTNDKRDLATVLYSAIGFVFFLGLASALAVGGWMTFSQGKAPPHTANKYYICSYEEHTCRIMDGAPDASWQRI